MKVNNSIYETYGHAWWDDNAGFELTSLRFGMNPCRYRYFKEVLWQLSLPGRNVLDIGCGGGFLSEEFAKDGFEVTGIDPALNSLDAARRHAAEHRLVIDYQPGRGEYLPFKNESFAVVACCDVLEHVEDVDQVIREVSRILVRGGVFLYDTVNRTLKSKLVLIKLWQDWGLTGCDEKNVHVWDKFIKPEELIAGMSRFGLQSREMKGISPCKSPIRVLLSLLKLRKGTLRGPVVGEAFKLRASDDLSISYMGWALKQ